VFLGAGNWPIPRNPFAREGDGVTRTRKHHFQVRVTGGPHLQMDFKKTSALKAQNK
jgi:hypothetical protein